MYDALIVYGILHQSLVIIIQLVFSLSLLAELPAILDSFSPVPQVMGGKHMLCSYTCIHWSLKVTKSVDNITKRLCETLQPSSLCLTASRND